MILHLVKCLVCLVMGGSQLDTINSLIPNLPFNAFFLSRDKSKTCEHWLIGDIDIILFCPHTLPHFAVNFFCMLSWKFFSHAPPILDYPY